jgi:replicative DNA helicase
MAGSLKDTIPPHNDDAERAVLGAMLQDSQAISTAFDLIRADDFYSKANERIFGAIMRLFDQGRAADLITVSEELKHSGELDNSGGEAYVASLPSVTPTIANTDYYAGLVRDCSLFFFDLCAEFFQTAERNLPHLRDEITRSFSPSDLPNFSWIYILPKS